MLWTRSWRGNSVTSKSLKGPRLLSNRMFFNTTRSCNTFYSQVKIIICRWHLPFVLFSRISLFHRLSMRKYENLFLHSTIQNITHLQWNHEEHPEEKNHSADSSKRQRPICYITARIDRCTAQAENITESIRALSVRNARRRPQVPHYSFPISRASFAALSFR